MKELRKDDQRILYDSKLTSEAYRTIETGGPEQCGCTYCRNFAAQRHSVYPPSFLALLDELGIEPGKEDEVWGVGIDSNQALYGGWMYFAGRIVEQGQLTHRDGSKEFQFWFDMPRLRPSADFGGETIAVEFNIVIPWVIKEHEP
jgi:hypothetical protein